MGNNISDQMVVDFLKSKIVIGEEYTRDFRETFNDITFKGMTVKDAIQLLNKRGYTKHRLWPYNGTYLSKILRREVILYTDDKLTIIIKEPIYM